MNAIIRGQKLEEKQLAQTQSICPTNTYYSTKGKLVTVVVETGRMHFNQMIKVNITSNINFDMINSLM